MKGYPWCFRNYLLFRDLPWYCSFCMFRDACRKATDIVEDLRSVKGFLNRNPTLKLRLFPWLLTFDIEPEDLQKLLEIRDKINKIERGEL